MQNKLFKNVIGQDSVKSLLSLYIDSYRHTERLPFLNFIASRGSGKSFMVREFRENLRRKDDTRPPILEVNCATIKNARNFFDSIYPVWVNNNAFLFLDEVAELPHDLQSIFLTILEVKKDPVRVIDYEGIHYHFDFTKISFSAATTDAQKIIQPLQDRLRAINLEEYNEEQLFEIFQNNLQNKIELLDCAKKDIMSSFRGNPRDVVVKAEDLKTFCSAKQYNKITKEIWQSFSKLMGILPLGLSHSEIMVVKAIGRLKEASLTDVSSITGFDRSLIQKSLESILVRKGLMSIQGKRVLTANGTRFYHEFCK